MERNKQNKHVVCNEDDVVGNNVDNGDDDSVDNGNDYSVDSGDDDEKHLTHLSQPADCCLMERKKAKNNDVCNKDNDDDNGVDNDDDYSVYNGDDNDVCNGNECAVKHITHLSPVAEYCLMEKNMQDKHVICNKDNDGDNDVDNDGDNGNHDSVDNGIDSVDNGDKKHLTHLSQTAEYCLMERYKQSKHVVCNKDNDVDRVDDDSVDGGEGEGVDNGVDGVVNGDEVGERHFTHRFHMSESF
eukprot:1913067-Ditylum_brightwellii.AAC.2